VFSCPAIRTEYNRIKKQFSRLEFPWDRFYELRERWSRCEIEIAAPVDPR
jgi:ribosomal protein L32E